MTRTLSNLTQTTAPDAKTSEPAYSLWLQTLPRAADHDDAECVRRMLARWIAQQILAKTQEVQR